ncbi:hypothetical protein EYC55_18555 [Xanthomonas oryzae]|nr:hypothetical protein C7T79_02765 [Xanthomonas oryzae pv. oryzicola]QBG97012.1 hypothetical protein EYC55_18555 [Xanthomonas oryzae]
MGCVLTCLRSSASPLHLIDAACASRSQWLRWRGAARYLASPGRYAFRQCSLHCDLPMAPSSRRCRLPSWQAVFVRRLP